MTYPIIPADRRKVGQKGTASKYPFGEMAEGDRFHVPREGRNPGTTMRNISNSARQQGIAVCCRWLDPDTLCVVMLGRMGDRL